MASSNILLSQAKQVGLLFNLYQLQAHAFA